MCDQYAMHAYVLRTTYTQQQIIYDSHDSY